MSLRSVAAGLISADASEFILCHAKKRKEKNRKYDIKSESGMLQKRRWAEKKEDLLI